MHNSNVLQVSGYELPDVPQRAFEAVTCLPGKVAVEMTEAPDRIGRIYLPGKVAGKLRCDVGIVLACQPPKNRRGERLKMDIKPGDAVLVRPYHGAWFDEFQCRGYKTERQVRFYGVHGDPSLYQASSGTMGDKTDTGVYELVPWNDSIVAKLVGNIVVPTIGNLMIRLLNEDHESLALPDGVKMPTTTGIVEAPGSSQFKRGQRVIFQPSEDDLSIEQGENLRLIRTSQVEAVS